MAIATFFHRVKEEVAIWPLFCSLKEITMTFGANKKLAAITQ
jgi:hypothetical protein